MYRCLSGCTANLVAILDGGQTFADGGGLDSRNLYVKLAFRGYEGFM